MTNAPTSKDVTRTVERLRRNSELYHAGHISHKEFSQRNKTLWQTAEEFRYDAEVKRVLYGR